MFRKREIKIYEPNFIQILSLNRWLLKVRCLFEDCDIKAYKCPYCEWIITLVAFSSGGVPKEYTFNRTKVWFIPNVNMNMDKCSTTKYPER